MGSKTKYIHTCDKCHYAEESEAPRPVDWLEVDIRSGRITGHTGYLSVATTDQQFRAGLFCPSCFKVYGRDKLLESAQIITGFYDVDAIDKN